MTAILTVVYNVQGYCAIYEAIAQCPVVLCNVRGQD